MQKIVDDLRLVYKCCKLYYEDELRQTEICNTLGISRTTVSRMLKVGKEEGIVKVEVINPINLNYGELERQLESRYGLKDVIIAETQPLDTEYDKLQSISEVSFDYLTHLFKDGDTIGIGMGYTLYNIAKVKRTYTFDKQFLFVPLLGGIGRDAMGKVDVQANNIASLFVKKFGGRYAQFLSPAIFRDEMIMKGFMMEKTVNYIYDYFDSLDVSIVGLGIPERSGSTMVSGGYVTADELSDFVERGAIGDIALRFYDKNGSMEVFKDYNEKIAAISEQQLKKVKTRIGVAGGIKKVDAIKGAIKGNFINVLITDIDCAQEMLK
ncbi:MAG: sugar-binding domain-containing protein [Anaerostipes sp.]|nr:sugar-binding domain-containing protein [Anaerostipes sp.]